MRGLVPVFWWMRLDLVFLVEDGLQGEARDCGRFLKKRREMMKIYAEVGDVGMGSRGRSV